MSLKVLALLVTLVGGRMMPPDSLVPAGAQGSAYLEQTGYMLLSWGADEAAVRNFQKAVELDSTRASAHLGLARALASSGQGMPAIEQVQGVLATDARHPDANRLYAQFMMAAGRAPEATAAMRTLLKHSPDDAEAWRILGHSLMEQKQIKEASAALRKAVKLDPGKPDPHKELAMALVADKQIAPAVTELKRYLQLRPSDVPTSMQLAEMLLNRGQPDEAVKVASEAAKQEPDNPRLLFAIATTLAKLDRKAEAAGWFDKVLALTNEPEPVGQAASFLAQYAVSQKRFPAASRYLRRLVAAKPTMLPPRMELAKLSAEAKDWSGAASAMRGLVAVQPNNLSFRMQLLDFHLRARHLPAAAETARQILRQPRSNPAVVETIAKGFLTLGSPSAAADFLQEEYHRRPSPPVGLMLCEVLQRARRNDEARNLLENLQRRWPQDPTLRHALATVAYERHQWQRVVDLLGPLVTRRLLNPRAVGPLAWSCEQVGRYADAATLFEEFARQRGDAAALIHVARQFDKLGDLRTAVSMYRRLLLMVPNHVPSRLALGRALGNANELPEAVKCFELVLKAQPDNALALRSLAWALSLQGKRAEAIAVYQRLAQADPQNAHAIAAQGDLKAANQELDQAISTWLDGLRRLPQAAVLHRRLGEAYAAKQDFERAMAHFRSAAEADAHDLPTRLDAAAVAERRGRYDEARQWYREAIASGPENGYLYRQWLRTFNAAGQGQLGLESAFQLLTTRPTSLGLAEAVLDQAATEGRLNDVVSRLDRLSEAGWQQTTLRDARGLALQRGGDPAGARRWYEGQLRREPLESRWSQRLGELHEQAGEWPGAVQAYTSVARRHPKSSAALADLARAQAATGQKEAALQALRRASAIDPNDEAALEQMVYLYQAEGRLTAARDGLRELIGRPGPRQAAYSQSPAVWIALGLSCELSGDREEASKCYQQALTLNNWCLSARLGLQRLARPRALRAPH